jgi:hypothetical protein
MADNEIRWFFPGLEKETLRQYYLDKHIQRPIFHIPERADKNGVAQSIVICVDECLRMENLTNLNSHISHRFKDPIGERRVYFTNYSEFAAHADATFSETAVVNLAAELNKHLDKVEQILVDHRLKHHSGLQGVFRLLAKRQPLLNMSIPNTYECSLTSQFELVDSHGGAWDNVRMRLFKSKPTSLAIVAFVPIPSTSTPTPTFASASAASVSTNAPAYAYTDIDTDTNRSDVDSIVATSTHVSRAGSIADDGYGDDDDDDAHSTSSDASTVVANIDEGHESVMEEDEEEDEGVVLEDEEEDDEIIEAIEDETETATEAEAETETEDETETETEDEIYAPSSTKIPRLSLADTKIVDTSESEDEGNDNIDDGGVDDITVVSDSGSSSSEDSVHELAPDDIGNNISSEDDDDDDDEDSEVADDLNELFASSPTLPTTITSTPATTPCAIAAAANNNVLTLSTLRQIVMMVKPEAFYYNGPEFTVDLAEFQSRFEPKILHLYSMTCTPEDIHTRLHSNITSFACKRGPWPVLHADVTALYCLGGEMALLSIEDPSVWLYKLTTLHVAHYGDLLRFLSKDRAPHITQIGLHFPEGELSNSYGLSLIREMLMQRHPQLNLRLSHTAMRHLSKENEDLFMQVTDLAIKGASPNAITEFFNRFNLPHLEHLDMDLMDARAIAYKDITPFPWHRLTNRLRIQSTTYTLTSLLVEGSDLDMLEIFLKDVLHVWTLHLHTLNNSWSKMRPWELENKLTRFNNVQY